MLGRRVPCVAGECVRVPAHVTYAPARVHGCTRVRAYARANPRILVRRPALPLPPNRVPPIQGVAGLAGLHTYARETLTVNPPLLGVTPRTGGYTCH